MSKRKVSEVSSSKLSKVDEEYKKETGLPSLDKLDPTDKGKDIVSKPEVKMIPEESSKHLPPPPVATDEFSGKTKLEGKTPLSYLHSFTKGHIVHQTRGSLSYYYPSCHMMDHIVHCINTTLCDNYHFKRSVPDYHPYILRLYFGVLFWIQCLRAGNDVCALTDKQHHFLTRFLDNHSLESLAIPGPLLAVFKTLCSSQPEFPHYGKVYPRIPDQPGPATRNLFMRATPESHFLPNIPGIFALLEDLNSKINGEPAVYPKKGRHTPVSNLAVTFGHKAFLPNDERIAADKWSLVSPGLQYPCEADQKLNEAFAERYGSFQFPPTNANDNLQKLANFLSMKDSLSWFTMVKEVANGAASFFEGSGTLADCAPHGMVSNQIMTCISTPATLPAAPSQTADPRSLYKFSYKLKSTAHNLPPLAEAAAAYSQTHIRMFESHPFYGIFGTKTPVYGPFWEIRPISSGLTDESSTETIFPMVKRYLKSKPT